MAGLGAISWDTLAMFLVAAVTVAGGIRLSARAAEQAEADRHPTALWGAADEAWDPAGRLTDYSYAGYERGERDLPRREAQVSVADFGAVGDGQTDDTEAFMRAMEEAAGQVIAVPPGRYMITDILEIRDSNTVLRGAGPDRTVIEVPTPLEEIRSNMSQTTGGRPTSNYSWSGGIIRIKGSFESRRLARVATDAQRGDHTLTVDQTDGFEVGDDVRLEMRDDAQRTLTHHLYAGNPGQIDNLQNVRTRWFARVTAVDAENRRITFDRPLRTDVRTPWSPALHPAQSSVEQVGIEGLAFEFPVTDYGGHFTELGYNAIAIDDARHCWVRDIIIRHADSGIFAGGANHTLTGVRFESDRSRDDQRNSTGHHGVILRGTDLLLSDFDFRTRFIHDITMTRGSTGNVVRRGRGEDLTFDHHKYANHANLFTDIDAGIGTNIFRSGGAGRLGRHCGAWTTWWNIRTEQPVSVPAGWATDRINLVGVRSDDEPVTEDDGRWFEPISPERLTPPDLYEAQLQRRLAD